MAPASATNRRVVVTGMGLVSPLGSTPETLWAGLAEGRSGVVAMPEYAGAGMPMQVGGLASEFTGAIGDFGPLEGARKKAIRKGLKLMCRETKMAVAAAQKALASAGIETADGGGPAPERCGVVLGSDYMLSIPEDYVAAIRACSVEGGFDFSRWGDAGLGDMQPLWMLLYLPNMPASHVAIFNDLRGPNNSLTMREASGLLAVGEAGRIVARGDADVMLAGATGTKVMPMQAVHAMQGESHGGPLATPHASTPDDPTSASRPFDRDRTGMVAAEGAAVVVLESLESAEGRGAPVFGEMVGFGASRVSDQSAVGKPDAALAAAMAASLADADLSPAAVGHINAHGAATPAGDAAEARAIVEVFGPADQAPPVVAPKANFGNLGAGSGVVELIASLMAFEHGALPRVRNYQTPDPACPIRVVTEAGTPPGDTFVTANTTPQGQAAAVVFARAGQ